MLRDRENPYKVYIKYAVTHVQVWYMENWEESHCYYIESAKLLEAYVNWERY